MPSSISINLATNYTTIISLEYKGKGCYKLPLVVYSTHKGYHRNHFMLRSGAGNGGCQDNSFVMYDRLFPFNYFQFTREGKFSNCVVSSNLLLQKKTHVEFHSRGQNFCKNFYDIHYQINKDQFL